MKNAHGWTLMDKKKKTIIHPHKLTLFQQCKLVECHEELTGTRYLLFFYKNDFLTARPMKEHEPTSFLAQAETRGIPINAPSPLFSLLVHPTLSLQVIPFNQLLSQAKRKYTLEETALIFSYFDSYIPHEKLDKLLKDLFFSYRRNGQLAAAYRLATLLLSRGYNQSWVESTTKQPDYAKAAKRYQAAPLTLLATDPLYVEQQCFLDYQTKENHELLLTLYTEQKNNLNTLILKINKWVKKPSQKTLPDLTHALSTHLKEEDVLSCLLSLLKTVPVTSGLHQDVYNRLIQKQEHQHAIQMLLAYSFTLSPEQQKQLPTIFEHFSIDNINGPLKNNSERIFALLKDQPLVLERLIRSFLPSLFKSHDLSDIQAWLKEVNQASVQLPIMKKLNEMASLIDEPDKQMALGHHYYELEQYEKAIDCFSWEMELQPNQPEPLQWLAKSYQNMGKIDEAKTYQQLLTQLQRSS